MYREQALNIVHLPKGSYVLFLNSYMAKENDGGRKNLTKVEGEKNEGRGEQWTWEVNSEKRSID